MVLYDLERSGNCYKIRLFLSILGVDYQKHVVNLRAGELTSGEFRALNPNGFVPVLTDESVVVYDSAAVLTYLARRYADHSWLPLEPVALAKTVRWLAFEQNEGRYGLARARAIALKNPTPFAQSGTLQECQALGRTALAVLDRQLRTTKWLAETDHATIADIACYPYTAMSDEGGLALADYPALNRWFVDIQKLPGYIPLPSVARG